MPIDLSNHPHWRKLVETNPAYRKAWREGWFPPVNTGEVRPQRLNAPPPPVGPGAELKRLLARLGIHETAGCACASTAARMNREGPDWCEQNMDWILDRMEAEAQRRKSLFVRMAAKLLVKWAIRRVRRRTKTGKTEE